MSAHGTTTRYRKGCHCSDCKKANTRAHNRWRSKRYKQPLPQGIKHNRNTYFNHGCTCEACKTDVRRYAREYQREYRKRAS